MLFTRPELFLLTEAHNALYDFIKSYMYYEPPIVFHAYIHETGIKS